MIVYLECASGVAGDMLAAALYETAIQAGIDGQAVVEVALDTVGVAPGAAVFQQVARGGLTATALTVPERPSFPTLAELQSALASGGLAPAVATRAAAVVQRLSAARAQVYGDVRHGAEASVGLDTLVAVLAVSALLDALPAEAVVASPPALGGGWADGPQGRLPVPAPMVTALLRGLPTAGGDAPEAGALTTPTGAALLAEVAGSFGHLPAGRMAAVGVGAGSRELPDRANVLRALLIEPREDPHGAPVGLSPVTAAAAVEFGGGEPLVMLEATVDDTTAEYLADATEQLRQAGARDAWLTPECMKKGRAGATVHALGAPDQVAVLARALFRCTSTFGVRVLPIERLLVEQRHDFVDVDGDTVGVRLGYLDGALVTASPEYADCCDVARRRGLSSRQVYERAQARAHTQFTPQ